MPSRESQRMEGLADAADPNDSRKPKNLRQITGPSWKFILAGTVRQYTDRGCTDLASSLTYRSLFAMFPAMIALVSMLSLFGQDESSVEAIMDEVRKIASPSMFETIEPALSSVLTAPAAGLGLFLGLLTALWTASSYIKAFSRSMNLIYQVPEGRNPIKFTIQMYILTFILLFLGAIALIIFVVSGPIAQAALDALGLGSTAEYVWGYGKWLILGGVVILVIALLYYATPNVKQPKFRWLSTGAVLAIVVALLATLGFFFYVRNFGNYNATYGALAGVIILLLWIYIINAILLFGAVLDSEIERGRELQAGLPAEWEIQLPVRDSGAYEKKEEKRQKEAEKARALRLTAGRSNELTGEPQAASAADEATSPEPDEKSSNDKDTSSASSN